MAKILKAEQLDKRAAAKMAALRLRELTAHASEVVLDARKQAARILSQAREEAKQLEVQAEEKGYRQGFQRGKDEGYAAGERAAHREIAAALIKQNRRYDQQEPTGEYEPVRIDSEPDGVAAVALSNSTVNTH